MRISKLKLAVLAALLAPAAAMATNGYFSHGNGMKAKGMAGVGYALPQDALAGATNPAGMAFVGDRLDVGVDWFRPSRGAEITGSGAGLNGSFSGNDKQNFFIPEFGYNKMMNPNLALGISVFGQGGMDTSYKTSPFAPFGDSSPAGVHLEQLFVVPTVAWKFAPNQSIGASLNLAYQRFAMDGAAPFSGFSANPAKFTRQGWDDSTGWGIGLGWTGQLTPQLSLGASYRSKTKMGKFDKYAGLFAGQGAFDIPETYGVGVAFKATPALTLAADVQQINYSKVDSIANPIGNLFVGNLFGSSNGPGFGWRDMTVMKLGVSWQMDPKLTLRAGYSHGRQPIPASQTMMNIFAPGVVEDHLTLGGTWALDPKTEVTVAYMHAFKKTINGSGSIPTGAPPAGFGGGEANIHLSEDTLGVALGMKF